MAEIEQIKGTEYHSTPDGFGEFETVSSPKELLRSRPGMKKVNDRNIK